MSDLKRFEEIECKATDSQYAKDYAQGYNDCLSQTNAKELLAQRDILLNGLNEAYRSLLVIQNEFPEGKAKSAVCLIKSNVAEAVSKAKSALTKPTNQ